MHLVAVFVVVPARAEEAPAGVSLTLEAGRVAVYVGERIPVSATLRVSGATVRNVGYPEIEGNGLKAAKFDQLQQLQEGSGDGVVTVYRFTGTATATRPGSAALGPARIKCDVLESAGGSAAFFGAVEPRSIDISSLPVTLTVAPLPRSGRPHAFSGAVGDFTMSVAGKPATVGIGDPLTLTTTIAGSGSLTQGSCPSLAGNGIKTFPPRRLQQGGKLVCEQVVVPLGAGLLPPVEWSYFDPQKGSYQTLKAPVSGVAVTTQPVPSTGSPEGAAPAPSAKVPAQTTRWQSPRFPSPFWLAALSFIGVAPLFILKSRSRAVPPRPETAPAGSGVDEHLAAIEQALKEGAVEVFYRSLLVTLQNIVASFTGLPAATVANVPPQGNIPNSAEIERLFLKCHAVRYGRTTPAEEEMALDLQHLLSILQSIDVPGM